VYLAIAILLAGCGAGYSRVLTLEEVPAGTCPRGHLEVGESCTVGARDYSVGSTVHADADGGELGGTLWFRMPMFHFGLDERRIARGTGSDHHSLAGMVGTQLRPMMFWPKVQRYVDVVVNAGFELGFLKESAFRGRGDGYAGVALDVFAPDAGPFRYTKTGVPGLRIGARYTAFVQGWNSETTFELGMIWRWGVPVDLYKHWRTTRRGD
jgi:hypothetical protein